jgi:hypothetical protein
MERAGLVATVRRPGRSPIVTIRDPTDGPGQTDGAHWKTETAMSYDRTGVEVPTFGRKA